MDDSDFPLTRALDVDLALLEQVESTNAFLHDKPGQPGVVSVALTDNQTSGRGRQGRVWSQPPGSGVAMSVRLPISEGASWLAAFPLLVGGVVAEAIGRETGLVASVKWPNDILIAGKKVSGILCEATNGAVIAGIGMNVRYPESALPTPQATSLHLHTQVDDTLVDRLVAGIITGLRDLVIRADRGEVSTLLATAARIIVTIGEKVRVDFPDGSSREGTATGIGPDGSLQMLWLDGSAGVVVAGDVWHISPAT